MRYPYVILLAVFVAAVARGDNGTFGTAAYVSSLAQRSRAVHH